MAKENIKYYGLIVDGVLVQKQAYKQDGFVEIPDDAICGMIKEKDKFVLPQKPEKSQEEKRRDAYIEAELNGELPKDVYQNIDEIWKALEALENDGIELPESASNIIGKRRAIKNNIPKK